MVDWTATIGGIEIENIFSVDYSQGETDRLGTAVIACSNSNHNRDVESGDYVLIQKNGTDDFTGFVTGKPTSAGADPTLEIECKDSRLELKYEQVSRVFYDMDTGEIIKEALNNSGQPKSRRFIHTGDDLDGWSSNAHEFELGDVSSQQLYETGNDFIFMGWSSGAGADTEVYRATFDDVPFSAIPGNGTIDRFETRLLVNNSGQQFEVEVDLRDNYGNNYIWPIDARATDFQTYELKAENAKTTASIGSPVSTDGTLEYRFSIDGELPESRAVAIDYAHTIPFDTDSRNTTLSSSGVENTGRSITRRIDRSVFELIKELATEDGYISYADTDDVLYYEQSGQSQADLDIDYDTTPVISADFKRDYENIINKVIVQGDGNVRVTLEDSASIEFYGVSAREEPIVDESIQTRDEAVQRGRGYLQKNAWADTAFKFEIADTDYQSVNIGQDILVSWPPEGITGTYSVSDTETDKDGIVTLSLTDTEAI